ncbi:MAG: PLP-dependent aminotransferase family protein [Colwellia sp.]
MTFWTANTSGCQNALFLALMVTCKPGDNVAVESPTFYGVLQLLQQLQLNVIEVPASSDTGINMDSLETALNTWKIKACVVTPAFATPTGATIPAKNRERMITLSNQFDLAIIEDDIYGDLAFNVRPAPIKALDRKERVILCSSFSKALSRDLRIGWISGGRWHEQITQLKLVTQLACNQSVQQGLASFMAEGSYRRHLNHYRDTLKQNRDQLVSSIQRYWPASTRFSLPEGGLSLWLEMDSSLDTQTAYPRALEKGIILSPGSLFSASDHYRNYLRLSFTHPTTGARDLALQQLASILLSPVDLFGKKI